MLLSNFMQGRRCNHPSHNKRRLGYSEVKKYIIDEGFELLSTEYKNAKELLTIKCNKGHIFTKSFNNFKYEGQRCNECRDKVSSKPEKEVLSFIKTLYNGKVIGNDRKQLKNHFTNRPLELDIWLPEIKKAIEYNGEYYHRDTYFTDNIKKRQCIEKDIDLFVIKEQDWNKNRNHIQTELKMFIGA